MNTQWIAYDVLLGLAEEYIQSGISTILDMTMGWTFQWQQVDSILGRHLRTRFLPILLRCSHKTCIARICQRYEAAPGRYDPPAVYLAEPKILAIWEFLERLDRPDVYWVDAERPFEQVYEQVTRYILDKT